VMVNGELKAVGTSAELVSRTNSRTLEDAFVALATKAEATA